MQLIFSSSCLRAVSKVLWSLKLSLWSVLASGISLQAELALWGESQAELSLNTHSQQKSSEELQVTGASCQK